LDRVLLISGWWGLHFHSTWEDYFLVFFPSDYLLSTFEINSTNYNCQAFEVMFNIDRPAYFWGLTKEFLAAFGRGSL
jgi:hypothetical protein